MTTLVQKKLKIKPVLDPDFVPASIWKRDYQQRLEEFGRSEKVAIVLERPQQRFSRFETKIFPENSGFDKDNLYHIERMIKALLWMKGAAKIYLSAPSSIVTALQAIYHPKGARAFDYELIGLKVYGGPLEIVETQYENLPEANENALSVGGHLEGCRIGFDLGGSDRKCAAVIDGKVVYSEEIAWDPYFQENPEWHYKGIQDSLKKAAEHLPRVDAIGGSAAGIYINNEVRVASLFRGVSEEDFEKHVRYIFNDIQKEWNVPITVVNDGEVTVLSGSMVWNKNAFLGISMGTSQAVGYVTPDGRITDFLNEFAFVPVDYRNDGPVDEWSGDAGCGVQYFSQQAVARLAPHAGFEFSDEMPFAERLIEVQKAVESGNENALKIYQTIGCYLGYSLSHYRDFYDFENLMILGRVTSGEGGELILDEAKRVLDAEFPDLANSIEFFIPDEKNKRHGQAIAAASLPQLNGV